MSAKTLCNALRIHLGEAYRDAHLHLECFQNYLKISILNNFKMIQCVSFIQLCDYFVAKTPLHTDVSTNCTSLVVIYLKTCNGNRARSESGGSKNSAVFSTQLLAK